MGASQPAPPTLHAPGCPSQSENTENNIQTKPNPTTPHTPRYPSLSEKKPYGHQYINKSSIRDARTPQPGEIVYNTMRYR